MLVQIDSAQLEWRGEVWLSNDQVGIQEINEKQDVHNNNQKAFSLPDRGVSKAYLFRTIFRGSGWSFANDSRFNHVSNDPAFWDTVNEKFYKKYSGLDRWHQKLAQIVAARLPIISPFGREWLIPMTNGEIPWTTLSNYPVQGTCADIVMIARISLLRRMRSAGLRSLLVSTVHDSIVADCPDEEVELVSKMAVGVFDDLPKNIKKLFNIDLPIPFPGEVKVGPNLGAFEKV